MKKIIITGIIFCVLGLIFLIASLNLHHLSAYVIGKITESSVSIGAAELTRNDLNLDISLKDISLKGKIEGIVKNCHVVINVAKGIYFKEISVSDFEINAKPVIRQGRSFTYPAERIDIRNGVVTVSGQKIIIGNIKAENVNIGDALSFEAHAQNGDYIGTIDIHGKGTYKWSLIDIKGDINFTAVNLMKIDKILKGAVRGKGAFSLKDDKFSFTGKVEAEHFEMKDTWLKKPVLLDRVGADVSLSVAGKGTDIKIENAFYKETPFTLNIRLDNYEYTSLELSSDFLAVQDVTSYATSEHSLQNVWDALKGGQVKAKKLLDVNGGPITVDLEVKDVAAVYQDMSFSDIKGQVYIDTSKVDISDLSGTYKTSRFYEVNGVIPHEDDKPIRAKGKYEVNLKDMPPFIDLKGVTFKDGTTDGSAEVEARRGKALRVSGSGKINNAQALWKNTAFSAWGSYKFSQDGVVFDPLFIGKDSGTEITCRGKWNEEDLDFSLKGALETKHLNAFVKTSFDMAGIARLDGELHLNAGILNASGDVNMDDLVFEIPGYMKKEKGTKSKAQVKFSKKGPDVTIDDLSYELESINVRARGTIMDLKKINGEITLAAHDVRSVAKLFFLPEESTNGDVSLSLTIKDLELPIVKLPHMVGNVKIKNGFLRLPGLAKPFRQMDLFADFKGTSFDVEMNRLVCGQSALRKGLLKVNDLESPRFSLSIDMERFNLIDFAGEGKKPFQIPLISQGSILGRASGEMTLTAKDIFLGNIAGKNLEIHGIMVNRKITIPSLKLGLLDGEADVEGAIDLSGKSPGLFATGKVGKIKSDLALKALGSTTNDITGTVFISGNLSSEGAIATDLIGNMGGEVTLYNRDGVIKKWNLLSKIFGALNLYDLLRGKVDFGHDGLGFSKLGATFTGKKGVFHTDNFLLDSPSMVLTGNGQLDLNKKIIDGIVNVSPLIVLDRTISQIPVIRTILKEPGQGFLYLSYSVKGPLDDPEITSNVIGTIGSKTLETLKNILTLPKGVFE
jgi:hypothetical protein